MTPGGENSGPKLTGDRKALGPRRSSGLLDGLVALLGFAHQPVSISPVAILGRGQSDTGSTIRESLGC